MLPADTPRLPKLPFFIGDAVLLGLAALIASRSGDPFSGSALIGIVVCVVAASILAAIPFLTDYARRQDEALDERQRALESLSNAIASSAEQISIAATGLHELLGGARSGGASSDPGLRKAVTDLSAQLAASQTGDRGLAEKDLAILQSSAAQLSHATTELAGLKALLEEQRAALREKIAGLPTEASQPLTPVPEPEVEPPVPAAAPSEESASAKTHSKTAPKKESRRRTSEAPDPEAVASEAPAKRPARKHRRSADSAPSSVTEAPPEEDPPPTEAAAEEPAPAARSSDGATRILVTAYIGIGNRLFIRGEGPGLSWDKGVPLQFVSIGKWRWETPEAAEPVKYRLLKNDAAECASLGIQSVEPGRQQEVVATF